jgi:hypothetical protein
MASNSRRSPYERKDLRERIDAIRRRAEAKPESRLATFLQVLDQPGSVPGGGIQGGPAQGEVATGQTEYDGYLLQWDPTVAVDERSRIRGQIGYRLRDEIEIEGRSRHERGDHIEVVEFPEGHPPELIAQTLARQRGLRWLEPNWRLQKQATTDEPSLASGSLWGMYGASTSPSNSFGSHAINAWARGAVGDPGNKVYLGVIDEGMQWNHPDLSGQVGNPNDPSFNGIDDDNNGRIDDVNGWDFVNNDNSVYDGSSANLTIDAHGTHVSGTIAAKADGSGVVGLAWNAGLISGKFLSPTGGNIANAIAAINYFIDLKQRGVDIVALNNSWGGGGFSSSLEAAIEAANSAGILFVAAAGNSNTSALSYPAAYPNTNVIAVASITRNGARSSFSNYGSSWVDLGAPGSEILSSVPLDSFANYNGTSMSAPHVTGAIGVLAAWGKSKSLFSSDADRRDKIRNAILKSATPTSSLSGITSTGGRLNLDAALLELDPSLRRFSIISATPNPVNEGGTTSLAISENGSPAGTTIPLFWTISGTGITTSDLSAVQLSGSLPSGSTGLTLTFSNDTITEGTETGRLELFSDAAMSISESALNITINDTSQAPIIPKIWGTTANDNLTGTSASEWITGTPATGTTTASLGRRQIDTVTGSGGTDTFLVGDRRGVFYNDGNNGNIGSSDYLLINDFTPGTDKIGIQSGTNYLFRSATIGGVVYTEIYWDQFAAGILNTTGTRRDELVARLTGSLSLNQAADFTTIN